MARRPRSTNPGNRPPDPSWSLAFDAELSAELAAESGDAFAPPRIFDRAALREVDRLAVERYGLSLTVLMENAGRAVADIALAMMESPHAVLIVCGPGHNGGDGLVAARHLHNAGVPVAIALSAPETKFRGDAATNLRVARAMGLPVQVLSGEEPAASLRTCAQHAAQRRGDLALIIDALLGTGLSGAVREPVLSLIPAINELRKAGARVLSVDLPSGLDCDTGESLGQTVIADVTVSLVGYKRGFAALAAQNFLGEVVVADIGVPRELVESLGQPLDASASRDESPPDPGAPPAPTRGDRRRDA